MANTMVQIYLHIIFHIKSTSVPIQMEHLPRLFAYIGGILNEFGAIPVIVGGVSDHIHFVASLPKCKTLSEMVRIVKAKSSRWIKGISPEYAGFSWQDGYGAFSVSPSVLEATIQYIRNQEAHHHQTSFADEYRTLLDAYRLSYDEDYIFND